MHKLTTKPLRDTKVTLSIGESKKTLTGMREYSPSNRDKVKLSKQGKYWCDHCDASLVHDGEKCRNCGITNKRKTLKKNSLPPRCC